MLKKRVTIKDIAKNCNVSAQTVSRAFSATGYINEKTKALILSEAKRLNYIPNNVATQLRNGTSNKIAIVFDSLRNVYFSIIIDYINIEATKRGYSLQTFFVNSHTLNEEIYREILANGNLCIISLLEVDNIVSSLVKTFGMPVMVVGRRSNFENIDYITTDDIYGGGLAAKYLLDKGCNYFAFATEGLGMTFEEDRYNGFCKELNKYNIKPELLDISLHSMGVLKDFIKTIQGKIGVFCFNDMTAYEISNIIQKENLKNIEVVGYDSIGSDLPIFGNLISVGVDKEVYVKEVMDEIVSIIEETAQGKMNKLIKPSLFGVL